MREPGTYTVKIVSGDAENFNVESLTVNEQYAMKNVILEPNQFNEGSVEI